MDQISLLKNTIGFNKKSRPRKKEYMSCLISFSKFSDVFSAFTCARVIGIFDAFA